MSGFGHTLASARPDAGGLLIYALGQAGFALRGADALVLIDPWLSTALKEEEGITRPVRVTAVPAAHALHPEAFGGYRFWRAARGDHRALGYLVELDGHAVYHAGDRLAR